MKEKPPFRLIACFACLAVAATVGFAQTTRHTLENGEVIEFPMLDISGTRIDADVTYDASRGVYRYVYAIAAPPANKAAVESVRIDVSGRLARTQIDPSLSENITRIAQTQPSTTIPVGITVPDAAFWRGGLSRSGMVFFSATRGGLLGVHPGATVGGFVVESRFPPGVRRAEIRPTIRPWLAIWEGLSEDLEFENPPDQRIYYVETTILAPSDPDDATLFRGGGQQPAEVDQFLRYAQPAEKRVAVPAGTVEYTVIVFYGETILPSTFSAILDRTDVTSRFHPIPGSAEAVTIPIQATTKLQLSVDGMKSSGQRARDSDTLTFLPP